MITMQIRNEIGEGWVDYSSYSDEVTARAALDHFRSVYRRPARLVLKEERVEWFVLMSSGMQCARKTEEEARNLLALVSDGKIQYTTTSLYTIIEEN